MDNLSTEMDSGHPGPRGVTDEDLFMHWLRRATDRAAPMVVLPWSTWERIVGRVSE